MIFAASTAPTCRSCFSDRADAMRRGSRPRRRQAYWITCLARAKAHRSRSPSRSPIADHRSQGNSHHTPTAFGAGRRVGGWRAPSHCLVNETGNYAIRRRNVVTNCINAKGLQKTALGPGSSLAGPTPSGLPVMKTTGNAGLIVRRKFDIGVSPVARRICSGATL